MNYLFDNWWSNTECTSTSTYMACYVAIHSCDVRWHDILLTHHLWHKTFTSTQCVCVRIICIEHCLIRTMVGGGVCIRPTLRFYLRADQQSMAYFIMVNPSILRIISQLNGCKMIGKYPTYVYLQQIHVAIEEAWILAYVALPFSHQFAQSWAKVWLLQFEIESSFALRIIAFYILHFTYTYVISWVNVTTSIENM